MTDLTAEAFDWNKVGPELEALGQAIADTIDPSNPMQSNESTMDCLEHLWSLGYRVVPHAAARLAIEGSGVVEAVAGIYYRLESALGRLDGGLEQVVQDIYFTFLHAERLAERMGIIGPDPVASVLDVAQPALPRPEEPRVERCAFEGCGAERVSWRHLRCAQSEPDPCPDPCPAMDGGCHPFTPEAR